MSDRSSTYSTELIKVAGIVSESIELLRIWKPGMRSSELRDAAIQAGTLARESSDRIWVISRYGFGLRYLGDGQRPARILKRLVERGANIALLRQLFSIYTARINGLFVDVAGGYYWDLVSRGVPALTSEMLVSFIRSKSGSAKLPRAWSEEGTKRVASGLLKTLVDFNYAAQGRALERLMTPPRILDETVLYIAYEARERGVPDSEVVSDRSFALFGLDRHAALDEVMRASIHGSIIVQSAGDLVRISYKHETMEGFIDELTR
jgi:hypothetical protein